MLRLVIIFVNAFSLEKVEPKSVVIHAPIAAKLAGFRTNFARGSLD